MIVKGICSEVLRVCVCVCGGGGWAGGWVGGEHVHICTYVYIHGTLLYFKTFVFAYIVLYLSI